MHIPKKSSTFAKNFGRKMIVHFSMNWPNTITTILIAAALVPWGSGVYAMNVQETQETQETEIKGFHPYKESDNTNVASDFAQWSVMLEAGFNSFDGDFNSEMKHPVYAPAIGVGVEYTFNPYIGLGLNYMFDLYRVTGNGGESADADILLKGTMHRVGLYLPVDLVSCFAPNAKKRLFNLQLLVGGGLGWYKNSTYYLSENRYHTATAEAQEMSKYDFCPYYGMGANFEFNLGRSIALGLKGMYTYFAHDKIDGRTGGASTNNDGIFDITLSLRYKIAAQKHSHERNLPPHGAKDIAAAKTPTAEDVAQEIAGKGLLPVGKDTVYLIQKDTIVQIAETRDVSYFVYFPNDKAKLDDQALIMIQQLAQQLQRDTTLYAFIIGYCDNTGSDEYNNALSQKRAESVADELISEYGIDPERVYGCGEGKIIGKRSKASYTPNRRVEILLLSEAGFNEKKKEVEEAE